MSRLLCEICGEKTSVADTRLKDGNIRRRYVCLNGHRFGTIEIRVPEGMPKESALHAFERQAAQKHVDEIRKKLLVAIDNITGELK